MVAGVEPTTLTRQHDVEQGDALLKSGRDLEYLSNLTRNRDRNSLALVTEVGRENIRSIALDSEELCPCRTVLLIRLSRLLYSCPSDGGDFDLIDECSDDGERPGA